MFEYLTGGQCYKCGGKVKYPDGGMTEQPMSPEQQMMMGQQMPQQPAAPQAKTLDAFADQLITFLLDQLNKGTSLRILKKTLTDSGLKSEEADQVLQIAKQQFDTVSYENQDQKDQMMQQMMQQQQMMGQQQGQPMQQMQQMTPEDMTAPGQDIAEAQYGGMMTGRRLKRYIGGGMPKINCPDDKMWNDKLQTCVDKINIKMNASPKAGECPPGYYKNVDECIPMPGSEASNKENTYAQNMPGINDNAIQVKSNSQNIDYSNPTQSQSQSYVPKQDVTYIKSQSEIANTPNTADDKKNASTPKSPSWNVPDWSDPYGTEGQPPSMLDTIEFNAKDQYKKDLKAEEEGLNDSDLFFPENKKEVNFDEHAEQYRKAGDMQTYRMLKSLPNTDPEAVRQLTPVRKETRRHMLQDVGSGKFNRGLAKASGLADPNVAGMIAALPSKGGLGSMAKVALGLAGAGSAFALGIQKVKPNETTVEYNADGQVISREGGEWNPFVDNRRKLRIGMQLYGGGGPIGSEVSPLPIEGWAQMSGRNPMSLTDQDQKDYQDYVTKFDPFKNSNNKGGNNNTVTVPPASNNQTVNSGGKSGNQGACPPGQDCSGQNASDPKWWQFGKRMQQEYGNTKRGDALGTTLAGRTLTGLSLANMGLDEIEARKQQEQLAVKTRQANNSMNAFGPLNLLGQEGIMNVNAGIGANFKTSEEGVIQDYGTALYGKSGGQMKYKQGGTYTVSPEELMRIINMGGEVEFLD